VWDLYRPGLRGASVGLGGSVMVDLLVKRHATFLMEACRRHREVKAPAGSAEGRVWRSSTLPLSYGAAI
jgi:hypothetical protein